MSDTYDVIIIGAGISGLVLGDTLARDGRRVLILEQAAQPGGNIMGFSRKGFFFDAGAQSSESVGLLFPILEDLGLYDPDEWHQCKWRFVTPDADVRLDDFAQIRADFKKVYAGSERDIDRWFDFIEPGCMTMKSMMYGKTFPLLLHGAEKYRAALEMARQGVKFAPLVRDALTKTGTQKGREVFSDERLSFLFGEFGNANMLLFMFFSFWYSFLFDYWHPNGGLQALADKVAADFERRGGELRLRTLVKTIDVENGAAVGVTTADGERYRAEKVVNTGNIKRMVLDMCDPEMFPYKYVQTIREAPVSFGMSSAYLGVDMGDEELRGYMRDSHHTLYWRSYETITDPYTPDAHRRGFSQINWTSMHDKSLAPEGANSMVVQVFTGYNWRDGWMTGSHDPEARTEEYVTLKEQVLDDIIEDSEKVIPGLRSRVVHKELGTPRTLSRYTLNEEGAIMGWSYDVYRIFMYKKFGSFSTPIRNLYTSGHYSVWPGGIVFSALSAKIVADGMYKGFARTLLT
jgi:phytoene dehydrogenase-like protein